MFIKLMDRFFDLCFPTTILLLTFVFIATAWMPPAAHPNQATPMKSQKTSISAQGAK